MAEPFKIILVDDEDEVRGRISSKISDESGFIVVGTAGNGYDAIELIEQFSPHVVLTDIKMPYIDGIELATIIRRDYPTIKVGFITGYDEFDYAREAIRLNACTYLTKPLTQEDISSFLRNLKTELDTEIAENYDRERIKKRYEQSIPLIIDNYLVSLLASGIQGDKNDIEQLRQYGVSLDEVPYLAAFVLVERNADNWGVIEHEKLKLAVRSRLGGLLVLGGYECHHFMFREGIVFVIKEKGEDFARQIDVVFNRMVRTADYYLSVQIDIGASLMHKGFRQLGEAYGEASDALSSSRFGTISRISYYNQFGDRPSRPSPFKESDAKGFEQVLRYGTDSEVAAFIRSLEESAERDAANPGLYVLNLTSVLANYAASVGIDLNDLDGEDVITVMAKIRSLPQLFSWVSALTAKIREKGTTSRSNNAERLLDLALTEIRRNFADPDLTMDSICDKLGISASYLGQLFKKNKGSSFVKFLTGVRMEKAKEALVSSGDRIVEIAGLCGYRDVYYFSHTFKKYSGVSPKKYREDNA